MAEQAEVAKAEDEQVEVEQAEVEEAEVGVGQEPGLLWPGQELAGFPGPSEAHAGFQRKQTGPRPRP